MSGVWRHLPAIRPVPPPAGLHQGALECPAPPGGDFNHATLQRPARTLRRRPTEQRL